MFENPDAVMTKFVQTVIEKVVQVYIYYQEYIIKREGECPTLVCENTARCEYY